VNVVSCNDVVPVAVRSVIVRPVPVACRKVRYWRSVVPVTVRFAVWMSPEVMIEYVEVFPAARTWSSVGMAPAWQFVPFARQTRVPFTVRALTSREVPVAFVKRNVGAVRSEIVPDAVTVREVVSTAVAVAYEVRRFVISPNEANRFVVVTDVPVARVNVKPWREVVPVAVRSEVSRPPYKRRVEVAKFPLFVTSARVEVSTSTWQFVPFERQTLVPPTVREVVTSSVVPVAPRKPRFWA
jgi:hypothetical protein